MAAAMLVAASIPTLEGLRNKPKESGPRRVEEGEGGKVS